MDVSKGTTAYLLREVKALLEKGWIKNALAEDSEGHVTSVLSSEACKFCMAGAAMYATGRYAAAGRTKEEVIGLFERAISMSKGDEL